MRGVSIVTVKETPYHFQLSPAELQWLAGAFGLTHIPLPKYRARALLHSDIEKAIASLQSRGLIRHAQGVNWQVDRLPAAIVAWLGNADWMLAIELQLRSGELRYMNVFRTNDQGMTISMENDVFCFTLCPSADLLITECLTWMGVFSKPSLSAVPTYELPQPETLIRTGWRDKPITAKILQNTGFNLEKVNATLEWLDTLQWVASMTRVKLEAAQARAESQTVFCGDRKKVWAGSGEVNTPNVLSMTQVSSQGIRLLIQNLL